MRNLGKEFTNVSATASPAFNVPIVARGAAFGDLNNDGQLDIVLGVLNDSPVVLRNNGTKNHWLGIRLVGSRSNRDGLGARVIVSDSSDRRQSFDVSTAGSYLSASESQNYRRPGKRKSGSRSRSPLAQWPNADNHEPGTGSIPHY